MSRFYMSWLLLVEGRDGKYSDGLTLSQAVTVL